VITSTDRNLSERDWSRFVYLAVSRRVAKSPGALLRSRGNDRNAVSQSEFTLFRWSRLWDTPFDRKILCDESKNHKPTLNFLLFLWRWSFESTLRIETKSPLVAKVSSHRLDSQTSQLVSVVNGKRE